MKVLERDANYLPKKVKATIDLEFDISVTVTPSHGRGSLSRILVSVPGTSWSLKRDIVPNDLDIEVEKALERFFAHVKDRWNESMRAPEPTPQQPQLTPDPEPLRRLRTGTAAISAARDYYSLAQPSITTLSPTEQEMRRREALDMARHEVAIASTRALSFDAIEAGLNAAPEIAQAFQGAHSRRLAEAINNDTALTVTEYNPHPLEAAIATGSGLTADEERELDAILEAPTSVADRYLIEHNRAVELEAAGDEGEDNGANIDLEEPPF